MPRGQYNTKQKHELLEYLKSKQGEHITVNDICEHFSGSEHKLGMTTVYRQLESMVDEGVVKKYNLDSSMPACFEYLDSAKACRKNGCVHLMCTSCGKLIHLHCDELTSTKSHILSEHGFEVDMTRTVLYGVCEACRG